MAYKVKKDAYQRARGGNSRILDVTCEGCLAHIAYYQKDGPGILKRMYSDRFIDIGPTGETLVCKNCKRILGIKINYVKESRPAYRLFVGAVNKKIIPRSKVLTFK